MPCSLSADEKKDAATADSQDTTGVAGFRLNHHLQPHVSHEQACSAVGSWVAPARSCTLGTKPTLEQRY